MKRVFSIVFLCITLSSFAQERWSATGGILGALNFSKFRVGGSNPYNASFSTQTGFSAGAWADIPLGRVVSFEPELLYTSYKYAPSNSSIGLDGNLKYLSVPLLLKFHLAGWLALTAGVQFDNLAAVSDNHSVTTSSDFTSFSTSLNGGLELFPHGRVTLFGRYIYGLTNMNNSGVVYGSSTKLYNENWQVGLKLRLFGHKIVPPAPVAVVVPPPVDTDGDGIPDINDKCPTVPGVAKYGGCPIPDTDGDGINDEEDRCPLVPGTADNLGCPEMKFYYKRDGSELSAEDKANLDKVTVFLQKNPDIHIIVEGHTSTTGTADYNMKLSQKRADNSMKYLISKGADASRIKAVGFGKQFPAGDNSTAEGRALSRRVVIRVDK